MGCASGLRGNIMKFTKATIVASAAALSLGLAACDSPQEEAAEEQADRVEDAAEGDTDMGTNDEPIGSTIDESTM